MAKTNSETQADYKARSLAAYELIKKLALEAGIMQYWKDADGYDEFIGLLESGEFKLELVENDAN